MVKVIVVQLGLGCVDYGDWIVQIYVGVIVCQYLFVEQVGDQFGVFILVGVWVSDDDVYFQVVNVVVQFGEFVEFVQVFGVFDFVEQVDWVSDIGIQVLGYCQDC